MIEAVGMPAEFGECSCLLDLTAARPNTEEQATLALAGVTAIE